MILLDTTIVNVAIPAMSTALNTTLDQILWCERVHPRLRRAADHGGRLGDLVRQRTIFAIGLFVFTVASALCGFCKTRPS